MRSSILTIALGTLRGFARDRVFHATILFAVLFIAFAYFLATLTIIESRKILLDFGFSAISFAGVAIAIFTGLNAVGKELENKTIYSVLSKPLSRTAYLTGKFLGCVLVCTITHAIMSATLIAIIQAVGDGFPDGLSACLYLMVLESLLVLAVSIFFSVSISSSFLAGCLSLGVFLIGRSSYSLQVVAAKSGSPFTKTLLKLLYDVFPNLARFDIREVVAYGKSFPHEMLSYGSLYFLVYTVMFLALASFIFQRKDLP